VLGESLRISLELLRQAITCMGCKGSSVRITPSRPKKPKKSSHLAVAGFFYFWGLQNTSKTPRQAAGRGLSYVWARIATCIAWAKGNSMDRLFANLSPESSM